MFDTAYGAVDNTVRSWVHDLVNGLYGFLHMIFGDVGTAWRTFEGTALSFWHGATRFVDNVVAAFYHLFRLIIPAIIREYRKLFTQAENFIKSVYSYVVGRVLYLVHLIAHSIDNLWQLVLRDVWRPLLSSITKAWHWITHEGSIVWFYITHPEKLVDLVWDYLIAKLEREAWRTADLLGRFLIALIVRNLRHFVLLIEDILDAIL